MNINGNIITANSDISFELLKEEINYKNITQSFKNYENKRISIYPYYINENSYIEFRIIFSEGFINISIYKFSRGKETRLFNNSFQKNECIIKFMQLENTFAYYLNNEFIFMHKDNDATFGNIKYELEKDVIMEIISFENYIPNSDWKWIQKEKNLNFLTKLKNDKYSISSLGNFKEKSLLEKDLTLKEDTTYSLSLYDYKNLGVLFNGFDISSNFINKNNSVISTGGRNLIKNSDFQKDIEKWTVTKDCFLINKKDTLNGKNTIDYNWYENSYDWHTLTSDTVDVKENLLTNKKVSFSMYIKYHTDSNIKNDIFIQLAGYKNIRYNQHISLDEGNYYFPKNETKGVWHKISFSCIVSPTNVDGAINFLRVNVRFPNAGSSIDSKFSIALPMLEISDTATHWDSHLLDTKIPNKKNTLSFFNLDNNGITYLPKIQIEEGTISSPYIENLEDSKPTEKSKLNVPIKNNIKRDSGTLVYRYIQNKSQEEFFIFKIGDFILKYKNKRFTLSSKKEDIASQQISLPFEATDKEVTLIWTWTENKHKLIVYSNKSMISDLNESGAMNGIFSNMDFTYMEPNKGSIKSIEIYSLDYYYEKVEYNSFLNFTKNNSASKIFGMDLTNKLSFFKKPYLESSLAPIDGSPILVENDNGPLRRHHFFDDETGVYRDFNIEYFTYKKEKNLKLAYKDFDHNFKVQVLLEGKEVFGFPYTIQDNIIYMTLSEEEINSAIGKELEVHYRLKDSYNIEFNEKSADDSYIINLDNPDGKSINVIQEGNRFNNRKLVKEIELNPILNPRHEGFLYITKNMQETKGFRISTSSDMLLANGMDSASIMVEAIDEYGNEVLSPYIDVYVINENGQETKDFGTISPITTYEALKARSTSGRLYYTYTSPYLSKDVLDRESKIFIVVYDRKNKLGTQESIVLKPTIEKLRTSNQTVEKESNIPFEYMSRYFERNNIPQNVLDLLDFDKNGQLTREDLTSFNKEKLNDELMKSISLKLKETEE